VDLRNKESVQETFKKFTRKRYLLIRNQHMKYITLRLNLEARERHTQGWKTLHEELNGLFK